MTDPCLLAATDLRSLVARREMSCREVLEAHLARIDAVDPLLNAIVTRTDDLARQRADDLDRNPDRHGPLAGLPIAHKDLLPTKGIRTTYGSPLYAEHVPAVDALIVERMRAAGALVVGKTNAPEFGAGSQTFNRVFGATRNPYDTAKTCGGSSGGAAVALAARMLPIADGSDTGGSLRNPAAFCNVIGFRPSPGRVPSFPGDPWSDLSTAGPMARTVDDLALLFSVLAGPDPRVPNCLAEPGSRFRSVEPVDLSRLRIAVTEDFGGLPVEGVIREAIRELGDTLASAGATVIEAAPDLADARRIFHILRATGFRRRFGPLGDTEKTELKDTIRWNLDAGLELTTADYDWAYPARAALVARVGRFFADVDLLLGPTTQVLPFDVTTDWVREVEGKRMATYIEWMESCSWITVTCCPALSLPAGFKNGLPVGAQLVAPLREDAFLLRAAKSVEAVTGYASREPVFAD
ncbi:MAG: amidase family protein [Gammaproteobacteria bacterium]|nr:amidase family protein [Gammaproteobacteria bacterium]